jgi:polyribonucleotide nucleotidyltransferase
MPKVGDRFLGTVVKTAAFGAFVSLLPGRDGLLHISKVGDGKRVERVEDFLNVGDKVEVEIAEIDGRGKVYLDKVRPEGAPAPAEGDRPAGRDRGDRGPRDRGDRSGDRGDRGERSHGDRGPGRGDRGSGGEGGDGGERRRRTRDRDR